MRQLDRTLSPALSGLALPDGSRRLRALFSFAVLAVACGLGLAACEGTRLDVTATEKSTKDDWRPVGVLITEGDRKFCALRSVPADMPELGIDKAWHIQCRDLSPIPGKLVHRRPPPGWTGTDDQLTRMLTEGAWATHGMAQLECKRNEPEVMDLRVAGQHTRGAVVNCDVQSRSLSTLSARTPGTDSEPSRVRRSVTAFAVADREGLYLGYLEQGCIGTCGSSKNDAGAAIETVLDATIIDDPEKNSDFSKLFNQFIADEKAWHDYIKTAGTYHDLGMYFNAIGSYSDANLKIFKKKGVYEPSRADILLQLVLNFSNIGQIRSANDMLEEAESLLWGRDPSVLGSSSKDWKSAISDVLLPLKAHQYCVVHRSNQIAASQPVQGSASDKPDESQKELDQLIESSKAVENAYCEFIARDGAMVDLMPRRPSSCSCGNFIRIPSNNHLSCDDDEKITKVARSWSYCAALLRGQEPASTGTGTDAERMTTTLENRIFLDARIPQARYALSEMLYHRSLLEDVHGNREEAERLRKDARRLLENTGLSARSTEARLRQASARSQLAAGNGTSALSDVAFALKTLESMKPAPKTEDPKAAFQTSAEQPETVEALDIGTELSRLSQPEARLIFLAAQALDLAGDKGWIADNPTLESSRALYSKAEGLFYGQPAVKSQTAMLDELYRLAYRFRRGLSDHAVGAYLDHLYRDFEHADGSTRKAVFEAMFRVAQLQKLSGLQMCRLTSDSPSGLEKLCDSLNAVSELVNDRHRPLEQQIYAADESKKDLEAEVRHAELAKKARDLPTIFASYCGDHPAGCAHIHKQVVGYEEVQASINGPKEAFLFLIPTPSHVYTFLVRSNGEPWVFRTEIDTRTLNTYARAAWVTGSVVRYTPDGGGQYYSKTLQDLKSEGSEYKCSFGPNDKRKGYVCAAGLYEAIFRSTVGTPLQGGASDTLSRLLDDTTLLSIVAGGDLGRIPFSILPTDRRALEAMLDSPETVTAEKWPWLIWKHATAYAPTVATYVHSRNMRSPSPGGYSIFSDPQHPVGEEAGVTFATPRCKADLRRIYKATLTGADELAPIIASYFPNSKNIGVCGTNSLKFNYCKEESNTIGNLENIAAKNNGGYIHLFTHGFGEGSLTCLREASILMSPSMDSGNSSQMLLKESRIMGMSFNGAMVVSQACDIVQGDDYWMGPNGWDGLARAFLFAGARGFIGSYWLSSYDASNEIMLRLFKRIGRDGMEPWQALWEAQKSIILSPKGGNDWSHPHYWGNFAIGGNPN